MTGEPTSIRAAILDMLTPLPWNGPDWLMSTQIVDDVSERLGVKPSSVRVELSRMARRGELLSTARHVDYCLNRLGETS